MGFAGQFRFACSLTLVVVSSTEDDAWTDLAETDVLGLNVGELPLTTSYLL